MKRQFAILCVLILAIAAGFAVADETGQNPDAKKHYFYEWTDREGNIHVTDSLQKVPERYREKARRHEASPDQETTGGSVQENGSSRAPAESGMAGVSEGDKTLWQNRMRDARRALADAEKRYQELQKERDGLFRAWGSPALAPLETRQHADQLDQSMQEVQKEIDDAKDQIDNVIPEEARKAGVPPGWLRE